MSDVQILTIAVALTTSFLAVLTGVLLNNNRLNDLKDLIAAKVEVSRSSTSTQIAELRTEMQTGYSQLERRSDRIEAKLEKIDDNIARILADHEHRLTMLEGGKK